MGVLELDHEWETGNLPVHGTWMQGFWGDTPIQVEILQSTNVTPMIHLALDGGLHDNAADRNDALSDRGMRVATTAMMVHNLNTGAHLGMMIEHWWFEADDDDFDQQTTFPISVPNQVIEEPASRFLNDNPLFNDYSEWCDHALTPEGRERTDERWREDCVGVSPCAITPCPDNGGYWTWCPSREMYDDCGEPRLDTPLGLARVNYDSCLMGCENAFDSCMMSFGVGVPAGVVFSVWLARRMAAIAAACGASGVAWSLCVMAVVGAAGLWLAYAYYKCARDSDVCSRNCLSEFMAAVQASQAEARERACS